MDGSSALRREFIEHLSQYYPVQAIDYPPDRALTYEEIESLVRSQLPINRTYVLLAESYSGPLAVRIAAAHPSNLVGLVLTASFIASPRPLLAWAKALTSVLPLGLTPNFLLRWCLLGSWSTPPKASALASAVESIPTAILRKRLRDVLAVDASTACGKVAVPVLSIVAMKDRLVPRRSSALICKWLSGATQVMLVGPHALLQAVPEEVATQVQAFVKTLPLPSNQALHLDAFGATAPRRG
jgi:pimeloyl-ACP methyl ester carboxylesterase